VRDQARLLLIGSSATGAVDASTGRPVAISWLLGGLIVTAFGVTLTLLSRLFGYAHEVGDMPIAWLVAGLVLAGFVYFLCLPQLISHSLSCAARESHLILVCIVAAGLAARLALFASEPILEDDYQRYLFDGAVTATGNNPYSMSPKDALADGSGALGPLTREGTTVAGRINHPDLKTVYPPVTQAAFALAYMIKPWSLMAWRSVALLFDLASLVILLLLLREAGRSPLWSALYWWNPVVIKELFNSAHMEAILLPFVLLALLLAVRGRHIAATTSLAVAVGAKIWPALLLPLILRQRGAFNNGKFVGSLILFGAIVALWAIPIWLGGLDQQSGFVAYLSSWQTNSALFPALERPVATTLPPETAGIVARGMIALCLVVLALLVSLKPIEGPDDLMGRASLMVAALVLLWPAQFPWYVVWFAPFLAFRPWTGFILLTATIPLYYADFYFLSHDRPEIFEGVIVWIIWVPVWAALAREALRNRVRPMSG
jgi:alpha-1,6-mannosyltransferase